MMHCTNCGSEMPVDSRFCGNCGSAVSGVPTYTYGGVAASGAITPAPGRLAGHLRLLGILWLAESALRLVPGLILLLLFGAGGAILQHWIPLGLAGVALVWMPLLVFIGALLSISAIAGAVAGWGLLEPKPWARTLALILGLFSLPHVPFGTALGIYTLWVLLPAEAEQEYQNAVGAPITAVI